MIGSKAQPNRLVTLINTNRVNPIAVAPYALDVLATSLAHAGFLPDVVDLTFQLDSWREVLRSYFATRAPLLIGVTIRNMDTNSAQDQKVFLPDHLEMLEEIQRCSPAPIVLGGAAFSMAPVGLTRYLRAQYAVAGPGEQVIVELADALLHGRSADAIEGLIVNDGQRVYQVPQTRPAEKLVSLRGKNLYNQTSPLNARTSYERVGRVDNRRYYDESGLVAILFKNGCSFECASCGEYVAKSRRMVARSVSATVDEMEQLTAQGIFDLHSADAEFNFKIHTAKQVLREVVRRAEDDPCSPLHKLKLWLYCQPTPFDEELCDLLAGAGGGGVSFGTDHACAEMLEGWKVSAGGSTYYTFDDAVRANDWLRARGIATSHEFLFGMPGENADTLRRCIDAALSLNSTALGFTLGIRVFPYSPLGLRLAEECRGTRTVPGLQSNTATRPIVLCPLDRCESRADYELQFTFDEGGRPRPVYYFSPTLPEPPEILNDPAGRRTATLRFIYDHTPPSALPRIMIAPLPADPAGRTQALVGNVTLREMLRLGYRGSAWSYWSRMDSILRDARRAGPSPVAPT
jgi:tryptophan 2-C-methyltransferase